MPEVLSRFGRSLSAEAQDAFGRGYLEGLKWAQVADWDNVSYVARDWSLKLETLTIPTASGVETRRGFHSQTVCGDRVVGDLFKQAFPEYETACEIMLDEIQSEWVLGWRDGVRTIFEEAMEKT
ncbi:MAG: hypothetical protein ACLFQR_01310 [Desulfovibrionales bacterium]